MTEPLARPGQPIDLQRSQAAREKSEKTLLVKTQDMEILQFMIPAGQGIPSYAAQGELILQCLEGRVTVTAIGTDQHLKAGQLLYLPKDELFSIRGIEQSSLLATIIAAKQGRTIELIGD